MKRNHFHLHAIFTAILATVVLTGISLEEIQAQTPARTPAEAPAGNPSDRGNPNRGDARGRGGPNLNDNQRQLFREAMLKERQTLEQLGAKLQAAQRELLQAALAQNFDENVIREKAQAVAKIQTELTVIRARAFSAVAPTLTPEQREQLENSPLGAAMLSSGGMGFGGPRDRSGATDRPRGNRGAARGGAGG